MREEQCLFDHALVGCQFIPPFRFFCCHCMSVWTLQVCFVAGMVGWKVFLVIVCAVCHNGPFVEFTCSICAFVAMYAFSWHQTVLVLWVFGRRVGLLTAIKLVGFSNEERASCLTMFFFHTVVSSHGPFGVKNGCFDVFFKSTHGSIKQHATTGDPYGPLLPCRLSHGIQAARYVHTLVAV